MSSVAVIDPNNDQEEGSASMSKLLNSSFNSDDVGTITRSVSAGRGMRDCSSSSSSPDACDIIDKQLMVSAINIAAIFRVCRDPKSRLSLMFGNRKDLAETYYLT